jgi:hypothetical protein
MRCISDDIDDFTYELILFISQVRYTQVVSHRGNHDSTFRKAPDVMLRYPRRTCSYSQSHNRRLCGGLILLSLCLRKFLGAEARSGVRWDNCWSMTWQFVAMIWQSNSLIILHPVCWCLVYCCSRRHSVCRVVGQYESYPGNRGCLITVNVHYRGVTAFGAPSLVLLLPIASRSSCFQSFFNKVM